MHFIEIGKSDSIFFNEFFFFQADASKCVTTSNQTVKTHSRNAVAVQTEKIRDTSTQTRKDNYTNVPRPKNFIYGLRGHRKDKHLVMDLTVPVDLRMKGLFP